MSTEEFRWAEEEYFALREQLDADRITQEQFDAIVNIMMFRDGQGRYWKLGADSGRWYVHNGTRWRQTSPYNGVEPSDEDSDTSSPRADRMLWVLVASLVLLLLLAGAVGYYLGLVPI